MKLTFVRRPSSWSSSIHQPAVWVKPCPASRRTAVSGWRCRRGGVGLWSFTGLQICSRCRLPPSTTFLRCQRVKTGSGEMSCDVSDAKPQSVCRNINKWLILRFTLHWVWSSVASTLKVNTSRDSLRARKDLTYGKFCNRNDWRYLKVLDCFTSKYSSLIPQPSLKFKLIMCETNHLESSQESFLLCSCELLVLPENRHHTLSRITGLMGIPEYWHLSLG